MTLDQTGTPSGLPDVRQYALSPPDRHVAFAAPELSAMLAQAAQLSRSPMVITDAELDAPGPEIVWVNEAFERMTGYRASQVVGRNPRILQGPATDRRVLRGLRAALEAGLDFEGEAINYRADGTPFVMSWRITALRDEFGNITNYLATQDDVTAMRLRPLENRQAILTLQDALAPSVPDRVGEYELASAYRPADGQLVGGDWVDVIDLGDDRMLAVVGDVTGHGADAIASMGQLRWSTRAAALAGLSLREISGALRRLATTDDLYATVLLASCGADGAVDYLSAGHPPAMIVGVDGTIRSTITTAPLVGLGLELREDTASETLAPGETLVAYTDGLVERRAVQFDQALLSLERQLTQMLADGVPPGDWASALVERMVEVEGGEDDIAVLTVRRVAG